MSTLASLLYLLVMVVVVVVVDYRFLRRDFGRRLVANIAIVAAFLLFYLLVMTRL